MPEEEPKIFIDEDWKSEVQREQAAAPETVEDADGAPPGGLPEPSFTAIVNNLAAQTMMALGGMPSNDDGEVFVDLHQAQFCISSLAILHEKTQGNLEEEELKYLKEVLGQLAQAFEMLMDQLRAQEQDQGGAPPPGDGLSLQSD